MAEEKFSNFLTDIIDADLAEGKVDVVHTRFRRSRTATCISAPPRRSSSTTRSPSTTAACSTCGLTTRTPAREGDEYVQSILQDLKWLGAEPNGGIFYGSDYFERCYEYAEQLIKEGKAYVDDLTREQMQEYRGNDAGKPSRPSPLPRPHAGGKPLTCSAVCAPVSLRTAKNAARQDRPCQPEHEHARPDYLPHQACRASPSGRQVVHLPDVRLCAPDSGTPLRASPSACAALSLRTTARCMSGSSRTCSARSSPSSASLPA